MICKVILLSLVCIYYTQAAVSDLHEEIAANSSLSVNGNYHIHIKYSLKFEGEKRANLLQSLKKVIWATILKRIRRENHWIYQNVQRKTGRDNVVAHDSAIVNAWTSTLTLWNSAGTSGSCFPRSSTLTYAAGTVLCRWLVIGDDLISHIRRLRRLCPSLFRPRFRLRSCKWPIMRR